MELACFTAKSFITAVIVFKSGFFGGGILGETFSLKSSRELLHSGSGFVTTRWIWSYRQKQFLSPTADCPFCGHRFEPEKKYIDTIKGILRNGKIGPQDSPCLKLDREAWDEPGLFSNCPKCNEKIRFNPFIAGGD